MVRPPEPHTAFVLGGGGMLGAAEVGMLGALLEAGVRPDLVLGSSVGAINGAVIAADPTLEQVESLGAVWRGIASDDTFGGSLLGRLSRAEPHPRPFQRAVATPSHGPTAIELRGARRPF